jgi:hypothetical protein
VAVLEVVSLFDDYPWVGGPGRTFSAVVLGVWVVAYERARREHGAAA